LVERADALMPERLSIQVESVQAFGAEEGDDALAVGGGRRRSVAVVRMTRDARNTFARRFLPDDPSGALVEAIKLEPVLRGVGAAVELSGERVLKDGFRVARDGRGHENTVSPDDGAGVPEAGNRCAPGDIPFCRYVP